MQTGLLVIITMLAFIIGYLWSENKRQSTTIDRAQLEAELRKKFLDKVFYLIELNESVNIKQYFEQAFEDLKINKDNIKL